MTMRMLRAGLLLTFPMLAAAPLAAHGFHPNVEGMLAHVGLHALPLAILGAAALLVARFTPVRRMRASPWIQAAGAAVLLLAAIAPLV